MDMQRASREAAPELSTAFSSPRQTALGTENEKLEESFQTLCLLLQSDDDGNIYINELIQI